MSIGARPIVLAALPAAIAVGGCTPRGVPIFTVAVQQQVSSCTIQVGSRSVTSDELVAIARREAIPGRRARISTDAQLPYRCVGGAIYALQTAGFQHVAVNAKPVRRAK